jgi:flagellar assembly protein FliH
LSDLRTRRSPLLRSSEVEIQEECEINAEFPSPELLETVRSAVMGEGSADDSPVTLRGHVSRTDRLLLEAQRLSRQAQEREAAARHLIEESHERAAQIEREAYETGYAQGEAAGLEMGQAKLSPLLREIDNLLAQLRDAHTEVVRANQEQLTDLALAIAARIVHRELELNPDQILTTVEEALSLVGRAQRVRLRVSQADFQNLLDNRDVLPNLQRLGDNVVFEVDPEMIAGGCLAQTETGIIDSTIETMISEMRRALTGQRRHAQESHSEE